MGRMLSARAKRVPCSRFAAAVSVCLVLAWSASAEPPDLIIQDAVESHDRLLSAKARTESATQRAHEALGVWYPEFDLTANVERYSNKKTGTNRVILPGREVTASISQLLWDFGASNATVERARLAKVQTEIAEVRIRQELINEAVAAYAELLRTDEVLAFARQSEKNIRRQTGLEETRISFGSGFSTDLLQAKTQLAGAQARRVEAEGAKAVAENRYRAVFLDVPDTVSAMPGIALDGSLVPDNLEDAIQLALRENPQLRETSVNIAIARQDRENARGDNFFPRFEVVGAQSFKDNDGGTVGKEVESSIKLELSFPFNLGFTAVNTLRAAQSDIIAETRAMADLKRTVEERVRNAWEQLNTARQRARYLFEQADIARAFLEVAVEERRLGRRSLIDVLSGETALINAQSDAVAAEADVLVATSELLAATGQLSYTQIKPAPRPDRAAMLAPIRERAAAEDESGSGPDGAFDDPFGDDSMGPLDPTAPLDAPSTPPASRITPPATTDPAPPSAPASLPTPEPPPSDGAESGRTGQEWLRGGTSFDDGAGRPDPSDETAPKDPESLEEEPPLDNPLLDWAQ